MEWAREHYWLYFILAFISFMIPLSLILLAIKITKKW